MPHVRPSPAASTHADNYFSAARALELLLTLAACFILLKLATPMTLPAAELGLQQRYAPVGWLWGVPPAWDGFQDYLIRYAWDRMVPDLRALLLWRHAGWGLALLGLTGWLALQLARAGRADATCGMLALWAGLAWVIRPFQFAAYVWLIALVTALLLGILARVFRSGRRSPDRVILNILIACVWPGWLLLTGVGVLTALDFAATGPLVPGGMALTPIRPGVRYFGLNQLDALWLASGLLLAVVCWRTWLLRSWITLCGTAAALLQRRRGPAILLMLALLLAFGMGWLGYFEKRAFLGIPSLHGGGKPHITGELLRLLACVVLAWFAYRVGEWDASAQRAGTAACGLLLVLFFCTLSLWLSDDKGPLLILALAFALLLGVPLLQGRHSTATSLALCVTGVVAVLWLWRTTLVEWLPQWSLQALQRAAQVMDSFHANRPFMAQALWLMDATPQAGFGLGGRVPYCGAQVLAGQAPCTLTSGAPLQTASDLAWVPLYASLGAAGALILTILLLMWLFALLAGQWLAWRSGAPDQAAGVMQPARRLALLPVWLVAVPVLAAQAQTLVTIGPAMFWSSLTGVTLPLLGYGGTALCVAGLWVGLAAHATQTPSHPT
ncbi:MAG: hypothetical protein H7293_02815 [Candidatus Saccharibacteria bacterium]|nr:hypothetical protein [Rhodoferax sp.]